MLNDMIGNILQKGGAKGGKSQMGGVQPIKGGRQCGHSAVINDNSGATKTNQRSSSPYLGRGGIAEVLNDPTTVGDFVASSMESQPFGGMRPDFQRGVGK
jgi:hypothetical protein